MRKATLKERALLARALRAWRGPRLPGARRACMRPTRYDRDQLAIGVSVEREHTSSPVLALEIAQAHLCERRDYYAKLERMERSRR